MSDSVTSHLSADRQVRRKDTILKECDIGKLGMFQKIVDRKPTCPENEVNREGARSHPAKRGVGERSEHFGKT